MEADWSVELASGDPVIVVPWSRYEDEYGSEVGGSDASNLRCVDLRFIDLRLDSSNIGGISEAHLEPALGNALLALNAPASPWWTAKCGLWDTASSPDADEIDPYELDADPEDAIFAAGCYIDLLPSDVAAGSAFAAIEGRARTLAQRLRSVALHCARVDLVVRPSRFDGTPGFAITWFIEACGATPERARLHRAEALMQALPIVLDVVALTAAAFAAERYNGKSVGE